MRIACLQFAPDVGDINENLDKADAILNQIDPQDLDLLVLPELAFSGYNFKSLQQIAPFLEPADSGITSLWARRTALKHECAVIAGYPEKVNPELKWPTDPEYYNAALILDSEGEQVANYRKTHLYYTDETWALEGSGFFGGRVPGLGKTALGICMDINPYKFQVPWTKFEFAHHILRSGARLVVISMAWITQESAETYLREPEKPDMDTITYWLARLNPVIQSKPDEEVIVVFCNRSGQEQEATYAGTSAVVGIRGDEVKVYGILGRGSTDLLVVDTEEPAYARLIYRPMDTVSTGQEDDDEVGERTSSKGPRGGEGQGSHATQPNNTSTVATSTTVKSTGEDTTTAAREDTRHLRGNSKHVDTRARQNLSSSSTLVEMRPNSDRSSFFKPPYTSILPPSEQYLWWPMPMRQSSHRRYHSTSSVARAGDVARPLRPKMTRNRTSLGSLPIDKTGLNGTSSWRKSSSLATNPQNCGAFGRGATLFEGVQHDGSSRIGHLPGTAQCLGLSDMADMSLNNQLMFCRPSGPVAELGFDGSTYKGGLTAQSHAVAKVATNLTPRLETVADPPKSQDASSFAIKQGRQQRAAKPLPIPSKTSQDTSDSGSSGNTTAKSIGEGSPLDDDIRAWLSISHASPKSSFRNTRAARGEMGGHMRYQTRTTAPMYINDWDEPLSCASMAAPRAMTFEEAGAMPTPVTT